MIHMPRPSPEETARAIELGHEPSTVSVRGLMWFFVWFFIIAIAIHLLVWWMYKAMLSYEEAQNVQRSAVTTMKIVPPEPRLQPTREHHERTAVEDLAAMRGRNNLEFVRRGWITEDGKFHFPDAVLQAVTAPQPAGPNPGSGSSGGASQGSGPR